MSCFFFAYQDRGDGTHFALYERNGSSVSARTLIKEGTEIPFTPTFEEWTLAKAQTKQADDEALTMLYIEAQCERDPTLLGAVVREIRWRNIRSISFGQARTAEVKLLNLLKTLRRSK